MAWVQADSASWCSFFEVDLSAHIFDFKAAPDVELSRRYFATRTTVPSWGGHATTTNKITPNTRIRNKIDANGIRFKQHILLYLCFYLRVGIIFDPSHCEVIPKRSSDACECINCACWTFLILFDRSHGDAKLQAFRLFYVWGYTF